MPQSQNPCKIKPNPKKCFKNCPRRSGPNCKTNIKKTSSAKSWALGPPKARAPVPGPRAPGPGPGPGPLGPGFGGGHFWGGREGIIIFMHFCVFSSNLQSPITLRKNQIAADRNRAGGTPTRRSPDGALKGPRSLLQPSPKGLLQPSPGPRQGPRPSALVLGPRAPARALGPGFGGGHFFIFFFAILGRRDQQFLI